MKIIHVDLAKYFIQNTGYMNIIHVDLAKYFFSKYWIYHIRANY